MPPSIEEFRWRIANVAIGPTTLRNQGASGVANAAREFLFQLNLTRLVHGTEDEFLRELDQQTECLQMNFPRGAQNWGAARKAINLYLGEAYYHRFVCEYYGLNRVEKFLELPLDGQVAKFLIRIALETGAERLPRWPGIRHLGTAINRQYQAFARHFAETREGDWARIHLDVIIWRQR